MGGIERGARRVQVGEPLCFWESGVFFGFGCGGGAAFLLGVDFPWWESVRATSSKEGNAGAPWVGWLIGWLFGRIADAPLELEFYVDVLRKETIELVAVDLSFFLVFQLLARRSCGSKERSVTFLEGRLEMGHKTARPDRIRTDPIFFPFLNNQPRPLLP